MPRNNFISSGGLNKDADKYYFPKGDYLDAKNIVVETGKEGGAGSTKTMNSVSTINVDLSSGLTNPVVKASIRDNDDNIYVLVKGDTLAKIYKITGSTATLVLTYTHAVTTDFDPDINIIGDVLVWNYREGGVPLSWYTERSAATITDITDLTLIKKPPAFVLPVSIESTGEAPSDLSISATSFGEDTTAGTTIAVITVTDATVGDTATFSIMNAVDAANNDASSRFTLSAQNAGNITDAVVNLQTVGTFNYNNVNDRSFILNIKVVDSDGLSYTESFNLTLTNVAPTAILSFTQAMNENVSAGTTIGNLSSKNGSADLSSTGLTWAITGGNTDNDIAITSSGTLSFANSPNYERTQSYNLNVSVTDVGGLTTTGTATVNITNINEPPVSSNLSLSITNGHTVSGTLSATDPESDAIQYEIVSNPSNGSVTLDNANTGAFTYTSAGGVNQSSFTYKAKDPSGSNTFGNTATVNISVPSLTVSITETDDDLTGVTVNTGGTVRVGKTGTISGTATATGNFTGNNASQISISSSENSADLQNLTVSSNPTTANDTTITFNWSFDLVGAAQVGDSLTFAISVTLTNQP